MKNFRDRLKQLPKINIKCVVWGWVLIVGIVIIDFLYAPFSFIELGERPKVGISGVALFLLMEFLCLNLYVIAKKNNQLKLAQESVEKNYGNIIALILFLIPVGLVCLYCNVYEGYVGKIEESYLRKSHIAIGEVYSKRGPNAREYSIKVKVGVDKEHTMVHRVKKDMCVVEDIKVGNKVLLRVSDDYPRVNQVIEWNVKGKN